MELAKCADVLINIQVADHHAHQMLSGTSGVCADSASVLNHASTVIIVEACRTAAMYSWFCSGLSCSWDAGSLCVT